MKNGWPELSIKYRFPASVCSGNKPVVGIWRPTVVDLLAVPPGPVHVNVNVLVTVRGPVLSVPAGLCGPVQPPDALQLVAFVVLQVSVEAFPLETVVGLALNVIAGAASIVTDTERVVV
jgi:hypothetical protein